MYLRRSMPVSTFYSRKLQEDHPMSNLNPLNLDQIPWYVPTLYGDIKLTAQGEKTEVEWENLSPSERLAMDALAKKFSVDTSKSVGRVNIDKPIDKVDTLLVKSMKRGRKLLSAVVFSNGKIEEIHRAPTGDHPYRKLEIVKDKPKAAVTIAEPTLSCPVPEFERAQVRATRVLREFLTPIQLRDFERTQQFVVTGVDSGHRYVLTSRQATPDVLDKPYASTIGRFQRPKSCSSSLFSCRCREESFT
jgi:hypothetical protein